MFWPCETRTSTCRSLATISSGLYRFLAIAVLLDVKDIPQVGPLQWGWIIGIRIVTFEACSGFTRVTARRIAQPPKATFVTRLQPSQLPSQAARQLPDQSTTLRVESSSTDDSRLRGALPISDSRTAAELQSETLSSDVMRASWLLP